MNFPYWVIYSFTATGIGLLIFNSTTSNWAGILSNLCIIAIGVIAIWNKKNSGRKV